MSASVAIAADDATMKDAEASDEKTALLDSENGQKVEVKRRWSWGKNPAPAVRKASAGKPKKGRHCMNCGHRACHMHSNHWSNLPHLGYFELVSLCDSCYSSNDRLTPEEEAQISLSAPEDRSPLFRETLDCRVCKTQIRKGINRHHCRHCGATVCGSASCASPVPLPHLGYTEPVRTCALCQALLVRHAQQKLLQKAGGTRTTAALLSAATHMATELCTNFGRQWSDKKGGSPSEWVNACLRPMICNAVLELVLVRADIERAAPQLLVPQRRESSNCV
jgi:hypothetical protein